MTSKTDTANALDRITHITPIIYLAHAAGLLRQRGADYLFGAPVGPGNAVVWRPP
jgi:hypothetical protein